MGKEKADELVHEPISGGLTFGYLPHQDYSIR